MPDISSSDPDEWSGFQDEIGHQSVPKHTEALPITEPTRKPSLPASTKEMTQPASSVKHDGSSLDTELRVDLPFEVLSDWPREDDIDLSAWSSLQLSRKMLAAIAGLRFPQPTPIQSAAIPQISQGHDVIGKAVTGSGKTLAYGIPILEYWLAAQGDGGTTLSTERTTCPVALILSPTRELAHQLTKHLSDLAANCPRRPQIATVTGGLSIHKQQRQLEHADMVVATPGRLWEVINDSHGLIDRLKQIQFLVVDEADRLLSDGHFLELESILDALDRELVEEETEIPDAVKQARKSRQTLVFSATFHKGLQQKLRGRAKIAGGDLLNDKQSIEYLMNKLEFREAKPKFIDVNPSDQMVAGLKEGLVECGALEKDMYLYALLVKHPKDKVLIFTNSISSVHRLAPLLQNLELPAAALHSTMSQKARLKSVESFSSQRPILVATDVAARGLDINGIDLIVHYHVPRTADMYVHRSGRTARAGKAGGSVMLCSPDEVAEVTRLISKIHSNYGLETWHIDRQLINRLRPRVDLSKKITDAVLARQKNGTQDGWLRTAADELGMDYDSEEFAAEGARNSRGTRDGKIKRRVEAGTISQAELALMKASLKDMLRKRVNLGVSERYLAGGKVDLDAMLDGRDDIRFLETKVL